jgi:hypothetical protein
MLIQQFSLMMTEKDEQNFVIDDSHQTCSALLVEKSDMDYHVYSNTPARVKNFYLSCWIKALRKCQTQECYDACLAFFTKRSVEFTYGIIYILIDDY